ncbi:hypothetical protein BY996DRAFT_6617660 [Phakopsora pachyrhizi]|nr:hypothetical protein BY996DRAFT_6617660 [Phakopsora pachyrhizi]
MPIIPMNRDKTSKWKVKLKLALEEEVTTVKIVDKLSINTEAVRGKKKVTRLYVFVTARRA